MKKIIVASVLLLASNISNAMVIVERQFDINSGIFYFGDEWPTSAGPIMHGRIQYEQGTDRIYSIYATSSDGDFSLSSINGFELNFEWDTYIFWPDGVTPYSFIGSANGANSILKDNNGNRFQFLIGEMQTYTLDGTGPSLDNRLRTTWASLDDAPGSNALASQGIDSLILGISFGNPTIVRAPEPASLGLAALGVATVGFFRRRKQPSENTIGR